jgi:DNA-binding CsgD family transcriptional regulator/pimeloyl-ACP methyl ester carboxylesterase
MKKIDSDPLEIDRDLIVDRIYQIAVEPSSLEDFIDFWHDSELATQFNDTEGRNPGEFDESYKAHLERAQTILQHSETARPDMKEYLQPYENLAAFVVSRSLHIEASNQGALSAFGVKPGDSLDQLGFPLEIRNALIRATQDALGNSKNSERLLKAEMATKSGTMLFRIMRIPKMFENGHAALIVSTSFYWRETIATLLGNVFHLTEAEQNVVRLLVEGMNTKSIAAARDTGEGTVRGQIKSIIGKMNVRSQTDIVRLVMTLGEFPKSAVGEEDAVELAVPGLSNNWLEGEVWKPFKSITVQDGRTLTYHDMGPVTGNPVLFSHTGSCMARWPASMIRLAFELNLRIICPMRAGYVQSDSLDLNADPFDAACNDSVFLLKSLEISRLPYAVQGSDFPFAVDLISKHPELVSELIGIGGRSCLPGGLNVDGAGRWQRFFVSMAQNAPHMVQFASKAVMAMSRRIGPEAMLRQLCKDSPSDLALLDTEEMKQILVANISLMAEKSTNSARAFAMEYTAFQVDWSDCMMATQNMPVQIFLAEEDPTVELGLIPKLREAYPWIEIEVLHKAGLALIYGKPEKIIPLMAQAATLAALNSR